MNEDLSRLVDPGSRSTLAIKNDSLVAPSGAVHPIVNSIPRFVPEDNYAADFGEQWNRFPRTQLDSATGLSLSEDRLRRCIGEDLTAIAGKRVLEVGSGAGRFTEILLKYGADLDSFDFSSAVEANALNNGHNRFTLVQADIEAMPFPKDHYDYVICLGVLQHTPSTERSIGKLWEMVAPGGKLVIDHYRWNLWKRLPPPIGDAEKLYRYFILRMPREKRWITVKNLVDFWFPVYWRTRNSKLAQKILGRIAGIHFYYNDFPLGSRERFYEWSLLDTHDGMTDAFKRFRTVGSVKRTLEALGAIDLQVSKGGNGVEARCRKPS